MTQVVCIASQIFFNNILKYLIFKFEANILTKKFQI